MTKSIDLTLGVSLGHDSGVALIQGSQLIFAANEERFCRTKNYSGFPFFSLEYVKNNWGDQISRIAVDGRLVAPHGVDAAYRFESKLVGIQKLASLTNTESLLLGNKFGISLLQAFYFFAHFPNRKAQNSKLQKLFNSKLTIQRVDHHFAHAASIAFPRSKDFDDGLVITLDGIGEGLCSRAISLKNGQFNSLGFQPALGSPALMYGYATKILGFKINRHEGKLTGLAAFGDPTVTSKIFLNHFTYDQHQNILKAKKIGYGLKAINKLEKELQSFSAEDIAAGVQFALEKIVLEFIQFNLKKYGLSKLYLSGGAFANVKLNQRIANLPEIKDLEIAPNMGDGGLAVGAAAIVHPLGLSRPKNLYLGTSVRPGLDYHGVEKLNLSDGLHSFIAKELTNKKIFALAIGKMEYGPRSLGNRSILYSAADKSVNNWLNQRLGRNEFMPFAPVVRDVDAHKNFYLDLPISRYSNMTITCDVTQFCKDTAPAIVHIDGTARPQVLSKDVNPFVYNILTEYSKLVENPILVNTSFNLHEEPIVRTADEAVESFVKSKLDYLVLDDCLFRKIK